MSLPLLPQGRREVQTSGTTCGVPEINEVRQDPNPTRLGAAPQSHSHPTGQPQELTSRGGSESWEGYSSSSFPSPNGGCAIVLVCVTAQHIPRTAGTSNHQTQGL